MTTQIAPLLIDPSVKAALFDVAKDLNRSVNCIVKSGGITIKGAGEGLAKLNVAAVAIVYNKDLATSPYFKIIAAGDLPALSGTVTADLFGGWTVSASDAADAAGELTLTFGTSGATLAAFVPAPVPAGHTLVGFIIVNPTGTGNFVGGTTDLDDATVVPNAVYIDVVGGQTLWPNVTEK